MYLRSRRVSFLRNKAAPECDPGTLTAWKNLSGMGGSINGGILLFLDEDKEEVVVVDIKRY